MARQRRRASAAALKEQEDAQKANNELKRSLAGVDLDAQLSAANGKLDAIVKDQEKLAKRVSDLQGQRAEASAALKKAIEARGQIVAPEPGQK